MLCHSLHAKCVNVHALIQVIRTIKIFTKDKKKLMLINLSQMNTEFGVERWDHCGNKIKKFS